MKTYFMVVVLLLIGAGGYYSIKNNFSYEENKEIVETMNNYQSVEVKDTKEVESKTASVPIEVVKPATTSDSTNSECPTAGACNPGYHLNKSCFCVED